MKDLITKLIFIFLLPNLLSVISCGRQKAGWKGTIAEVNGVTVVHNPSEPMSKNAGRVLQLIEELRITDTQGDFY